MFFFKKIIIIFFQLLKSKVCINKIKRKEKPIAKSFYNDWFIQKPNNEISVFLSGCIGDFIYAMSYLGAFAEQNENKKIVIYYEKERQNLIDTYNLPSNCDLRFMKDNNEAYKMGCFMRTKTYAKAGLNSDIISSVPSIVFPNISVLKAFREKVYRIQKGNYSIVFPSVPEIEITAIPNFQQNKSKIVVLNHSSGGSVIERTVPIFEKIADKLIQNGYEVYTNIIKEQAPIKGTKGLNCSIFELYNICKHIPLFISVRSGIADLCINSKVNMFVLYWGVWHKDNMKWKKEFSLIEWHPKGEICEYIPYPFHFLGSNWENDAYICFCDYVKKNNILSLA